MKTLTLLVSAFLGLSLSKSIGQSTNEIVVSLIDSAHYYDGQHKYTKAIALADSAYAIASRVSDTINSSRAEFYKEVARQKLSDDFDIIQLEKFEHFFDIQNLKIDLARSKLALAGIYYKYGEVQNEINKHLEALDIYQELDNQSGIAAVHNDLSLMYYDQHNYDKAFHHIRKAIEIDKSNSDNKTKHTHYNNLAIIYEHTGPVDSAISIHLKALEYGKQAKDPYCIGLSLSNLGNNYSNNKEFKRAQDYLYRALQIRDSIGYDRGLAYTHNRLGNMHLQLNRLSKAQYHAEQALKHALKSRELKVTRMSYGLLSDIASKKGDAQKELEYFRKEVELIDSLKNFENTREITRISMRHQFDQKIFRDSIARAEKERQREAIYQAELRKKNRTRNYLLVLGIFLLLVAGGLYNRWQYVSRSRDLISKEKERSEKLLLNILPLEVADELKATGKSEARDFDMVSILFTDFISFTELSGQMPANELVEEINTCFKAFDNILEKFQVEKIKTIGDAYMAAGGLPVPRKDSTRNTVLAALEMQEFMKQRKKEKDARNELAFEMRAGIHSGPVVAGIVGIKKFQYDLWGDTVNTASRMETNGEAGKVNISRLSYELIKDYPDFAFERRGYVEVKGKGNVEMFFVEKSTKPE